MVALRPSTYTARSAPRPPASRIPHGGNLTSSYPQMSTGVTYMYFDNSGPRQIFCSTGCSFRTASSKCPITHPGTHARSDG